MQEAENRVKSIMTRSGHKVVFTEDESIIITDKSGNEIHLDTTGSNINITAPETMTLNCRGYVEVSGIVKKLNGYSSGKFVVLFPSKNNQTAAHEFLHSFELPHSFSNSEADANAAFTYEYAKTENLMDYSHRISKTRFSLWKWQWAEANANTK